MKDIFDECNFGEFKLKSRIIRTGAWERQTEDGGFLSYFCKNTPTSQVGCDEQLPFNLLYNL